VNRNGSISAKKRANLLSILLDEFYTPHSDVKIIASRYLGDSECIVSKDNIEFVLMHDEKKKLFKLFYLVQKYQLKRFQFLIKKSLKVLDTSVKH